MKSVPLGLILVAFLEVGCAGQGWQPPPVAEYSRFLWFDGRAVDVSDEAVRAHLVGAVRESLGRDGIELAEASYKQTRQQRFDAAGTAYPVVTCDELHMSFFYFALPLRFSPQARTGAIINGSATIRTTTDADVPRSGSAELFLTTGEDARRMKEAIPASFRWVRADNSPASLDEIASAHDYAFKSFRNALCKVLPPAEYAESVQMYCVVR